MCFTKEIFSHIKVLKSWGADLHKMISVYSIGALEIVQFSSGAVNKHALGLYHLFLGKIIDLLRSCLQLINMLSCFSNRHVLYLLLAIL
jgi:hypothetical protein